MKKFIIFLMGVAFILYSQLGSSKVNEQDPVAPTDSSWVQGVKVDVDSTVQNFRIADLINFFTLTKTAQMEDSIGVAISDSLNQANVVMANNLVVHGEIAADDTLHLGDASLINGSGWLGLFNTGFYVSGYNIETTEEVYAGDTLKIGRARFINKYIAPNWSNTLSILAPQDGNGNIEFNSTLTKVNSDSTDITNALRAEDAWIDTMNVNTIYKGANGLTIINEIAGRAEFEEDTIEFKGQAHFNPYDTAETNLIIGKGAGKSGMTGANNTLLGYITGEEITSGAFNTFIGSQAGKNNTSGTHSVYIGASAGGANTTGGYNNFIGVGSGASNSSGVRNNFFGRNAGTVSTTGESNNFMGFSAGGANSSGSYNTLIGDSAGIELTTGKHNIFLGSNAGAGYTIEDSLFIAGHGTNPLIIGNMTSGVADRGVTIDGHLTATDFIVGATSILDIVSDSLAAAVDSSGVALDNAKIYTDVRETAIETWVQGNYTANDSSVCVIRNGDSLLVRTVYDSTRDLVQYLEVFDEAVVGDNNPMNFMYTYLIPNTNVNTLAGILTSAVAIHASSDDAAPFYFNGTYIGANHGCSFVRNVTSGTHGLDATSCGVEWTDWSATKWYIIRIVDGSTLWMLSEDIGAGDIWSFDTTIDGNLWNGADSLIVDSYVAGQMEPALKNQIKKAYLTNDTEITTDGVYYTDKLKVSEVYDIVNPSAQLDSVIAHAGEFIDINTGASNLELNNEFNFDKYGNCVVKSTTSNPNYEIDISIAGFIQSGIINIGAYDSIYVYIPNTLTYNDGSIDWNLKRLQDFSVTPASALTLSTAYYAKSYQPIYRCNEYLGTTVNDLDVCFAHGYALDKSDTKAKNRLANNTNAWQIATTRKSYPRVYDSGYGNVAKTTMMEATAFRSYVDPTAYSDNATSVNFYQDKDNFVVMIDYQSLVAFDKITLPEEMNDMDISVLDKHDSITVHSRYVADNKIYISSDFTTGYAVLKLSNKSNIIPYATTFEDSAQFEDNVNIDGVLTVYNDIVTDDSEYNTFLGINSGGSISSGLTNTFIGYNSGRLIGSGSANTFVGNSTGSAASNTSNNTMVGNQAGRINNSNGSTYIGSSSGYAATTAISTCLGTASGYKIITGTGNTLLGYYSGFNTTGINNTFTGYESGYSNTTGRNNTFIGKRAGYNNTAYKYTIAIGDSVVVTADSILVVGHGNDPLLTGNMTVGVANRGLTIDGKLTTSSTVQMNTDNGKTQVVDVSTTKHTVNIRPNSGKSGLLSFTEDAVGDRWVIASETGSTDLKFATGSTTSYADKVTLNASGDIILTDQGSSVNSGKITMVADNTGTTQTGEINVNYGVNPYIRMSPPNSAGTATPTIDMRSDLISFFNGLADTDYYFNFNGESNDGTITYMEDEDRFDFDNDVLASGDITATAFHGDGSALTGVAGGDSTFYAVQVIDTVAIGYTTPDETLPVFTMTGDADDDAEDVTETLQITLDPNTNPTNSTWNFTSTQSKGYNFDKSIYSTSGTEFYATPSYTFKSDNDVTLQGDRVILKYQSDVTSGDALAFSQSNTSWELNGSAEQAIMSIKAEIDKASGNYIGILVDAAETATDGSSNKLLSLRVNGVDQFTVSNLGNVDMNRSLDMTYENATAEVAPYIKINRAGASGADVVDNDKLGDIRFYGMGNSAYQLGAYISCEVDGTPGESAADMPTKLVFQTAPDGTCTPTTKFEITNDSIYTATDLKVHGDVTANDYIVGSTSLFTTISDSTQAAIDSARTVLTDAKAYTDTRETAITTAYETMVGDSTSALTDSLKVVLSDAKANTADQIGDSLGQANLVIPNNLTVHGTMTAQYVKSDSLTCAKILFADETPVAVELGGDDTWTRFNGENILVMESRGNISKTSKSIVITEAGTYSIICSASIGCDQATATVHAGIAKNNTVSTYAQVEYSAKDAGDVHDVTIPNLPELVVGDSLYLMVKSDSQTDSLRIKHLNFIVKREN